MNDHHLQIIVVQNQQRNISVGLEKPNVSVGETNPVFFLRLSCLGPVEFLRGKRFWLFAKKDDGGMSAEVVPMVNVQPSSLTQGLWRSGIVGRRRRR